MPPKFLGDNFFLDLFSRKHASQSRRWYICASSELLKEILECRETEALAYLLLSLQLHTL